MIKKILLEMQKLNLMIGIESGKILTSTNEKLAKANAGKPKPKPKP